MPLGKAGRVLVRDAVRSRTRKRFDKQWRERWNEFCRVSKLHPVPISEYREGALPAGEVSWFSARNGDPEAFEEELDSLRLACAVLGRPDAVEDILRPLLDATVSVVLWVRSTCPPTDLARVRELVNEGPLKDLPERVRLIRRKPEELGKHLTLLWDNPLDALSGGPYAGAGTGGGR